VTRAWPTRVRGVSAKIHSPPTALALFISAGRRALSVISQEVRSFKRSSSGGKVKPGKAFNKGGLSAARMQYDSSSDEEDLAPKTKGKLRYVPSRWLCECARGLRLLTLTHSTRDGTHTSHPRLFRQRAWMRASARGLTAGILKRRAMCSEVVANANQRWFREAWELAHAGEYRQMVRAPSASTPLAPHVMGAHTGCVKNSLCVSQLSL
jgi:hypothetical protein